MKIEIDMGKLRGAILKRKGLRTFEMMAVDNMAYDGHNIAAV